MSESRVEWRTNFAGLQMIGAADAVVCDETGCWTAESKAIAND